MVTASRCHLGPIPAFRSSLLEFLRKYYLSRKFDLYSSRGFKGFLAYLVDNCRSYQEATLSKKQQMRAQNATGSIEDNT